MFVPDILRRGRGKELLDRVRPTVRTLRNTLRWVANRPDYRRWTSADGLEEWWNARTAVIANLVPAGSRVIEFGAGRRYLERVLPSGCSYTPSDLVDRGPDTMVCDLNQRPLPDLRDRAFTVAVFGGVLEYLRDVTSLVAWLEAIGIRSVVASFDPVPGHLGLAGRVKEQRRRLYFGYMCNWTEEELRRCFEEAHMQCVERRLWTNQVIIRFDKRV
jgi:hypothetical protein